MSTKSRYISVAKGTFCIRFVRNYKKQEKEYNMAQERSYEERVEDFIKKFLDSKGIKYYTKTEKLNDDIAQALEKHPSKSGGKGKNYPDIQCMITTKGLKNIPVMIECKGKRAI